MDKLELTIGEKCFFDSFAGMIKCVIIGVKKENHIYLHETGQSTAYNLEVKITAKKHTTYKYGEIVYTSGLHVIPRQCYHKTGIFTYRVYPDYDWLEG